MSLVKSGPSTKAILNPGPGAKVVTSNDGFYSVALDPQGNTVITYEGPAAIESPLRMQGKKQVYWYYIDKADGTRTMVYLRSKTAARGRQLRAALKRKKATAPASASTAPASASTKKHKKAAKKAPASTKKRKKAAKNPAPLPYMLSGIKPGDKLVHLVNKVIFTVSKVTPSKVTLSDGKTINASEAIYYRLYKVQVQADDGSWTTITLSDSVSDRMLTSLTGTHEYGGGWVGQWDWARGTQTNIGKMSNGTIDSTQATGKVRKIRKVYAADRLQKPMFDPNVLRLVDNSKLPAEALRIKQQMENHITCRNLQYYETMHAYNRTPVVDLMTQQVGARGEDTTRDILTHGTPLKNVEPIIKNGFQLVSRGSQTTSYQNNYGEMVYLDADQCHHSTYNGYSKPDDKGYRAVLLVDTLIGARQNTSAGDFLLKDGFRSGGSQSNGIVTKPAGNLMDCAVIGCFLFK